MGLLQQLEDEQISEVIYSHMPPGMGLRIHSSGTQVHFQSTGHVQWRLLLGNSLAIIWSARHNVFCLTLSFVNIHQTFVGKAFRITLHNDYLAMIQDGQLDDQSFSLPFQLHATTPYVGNKAFIADLVGRAKGKHLFTDTGLNIAVNMETMSSGVDPEVATNIIKHNKINGIPKKTFDVPTFLEGNSFVVLLSCNMTVRGNHVDMNEHMNYKGYIFGFIVCIRGAIAAGKISRYRGVSPDDVIPRDTTVVFEKSCQEGDEICFRLYDSDSDLFTVACYKGEKRLAYGHHQLVLLPKRNKSKI